MQLVPEWVWLRRLRSSMRIKCAMVWLAVFREEPQLLRRHDVRRHKQRSDGWRSSRVQVGSSHIFAAKLPGL